MVDDAVNRIEADVARTERRVPVFAGTPGVLAVVDVDVGLIVTNGVGVGVVCNDGFEVALDVAVAFCVGADVGPSAPAIIIFAGVVPVITF